VFACGLEGEAYGRKGFCRGGIEERGVDKTLKSPSQTPQMGLLVSHSGPQRFPYPCPQNMNVQTSEMKKKETRERKGRIREEKRCEKGLWGCPSVCPSVLLSVLWEEFIDVNQSLVCFLLLLTISFSFFFWVRTHVYLSSLKERYGSTH
jgi:hypothetical protein